MTLRAVALAPFFVVVACSSAPSEQPVIGAPAGVSVPQSAGTCAIHVRFETSECDACMQEQCCAETEACFTKNEDCSALHSCAAPCPDATTNFFVPIGTGDGGAAIPPDDDGSGSTNACRAGCEGAHPASVAVHRAYDACIRSRCMPACAGR